MAKKITKNAKTGKKNKKISKKETVVNDAQVVEPEISEPISSETKVTEQITKESSTDQKSYKLSSSVSNLFADITKTSEKMLNTQKLFNQLLKKTLKSYDRDRKDFEKNLARDRRKAKKDPNRKKRDPSGFAVATDISDNLCDFLSLDRGTKLSRTDVTKLVTQYIREKNLQIPENRRSFKPDKNLSSILGPLQKIDEDKGFTYFNLQRYITPHITSSASTSKH